MSSDSSARTTLIGGAGVCALGAAVGAAVATYLKDGSLSRRSVASASAGVALLAASFSLRRRQKLARVNLMGPPYRWLLPDCRCFYQENLYVKFATGCEKVDRYYTMPDVEMSAEDFWALNAMEGVTYSEETKADILAQVRKECLRRLGLSEQYRRNAELCAAEYTPLHPELFPPVDAALPREPTLDPAKPPELAPGLPAREVFTEAFLETWSDIVTHANAGEKEFATFRKAEKGFSHVHNECFQIDLFTQAFVQKFKEEIHHFKSQNLSHQYPNNMNRAGCILNEIGLGPLMDRLISMYLGPVCKAMYPRFLKDGFEAHHSFLVAYSMGTDKTLGVHDDNSEVTINVALSDDYKGASLALYHHARVAHPQVEKKTAFHWKVPAGTMLFHPGEMLHEVLPLTEGNRMGLIIWIRSTKTRERDGCPLCLSPDRLIYRSDASGSEFRRLPSVGLKDINWSCEKVSREMRP